MAEAWIQNANDLSTEIWQHIFDPTLDEHAFHALLIFRLTADLFRTRGFNEGELWFHDNFSQFFSDVK